jgi:hypothetical protein
MKCTSRLFIHALRLNEQPLALSKQLASQSKLQSVYSLLPLLGQFDGGYTDTASSSCIKELVQHLGVLRLTSDGCALVFEYSWRVPDTANRLAELKPCGPLILFASALEQQAIAVQCCRHPSQQPPARRTGLRRYPAAENSSRATDLCLHLVYVLYSHSRSYALVPFAAFLFSTSRSQLHVRRSFKYQGSIG